MPDFPFPLNQSIPYTGASLSHPSEGTFSELAGVNVASNHPGGLLQIELFGFSFDYPTSSSEMGLDLLLVINGIEQQPYQRFIPSTRFEPTVRRFSFVTSSLKEGQHYTVEFKARSFLYNGPPCPISIVGTATLRLSAQVKVLSFAPEGLQTIDVESALSCRVNLSAPEPGPVTVTIASSKGRVLPRSSSIELQAGETASTFTITGTTGGSDFLTATADGFQPPASLTVLVKPALLALQPAEGPPGTTITLHGKGFTPSSDAFIDGAGRRATQFINSGTLSTRVPQFNPGRVWVSVEVHDQWTDHLYFTVKNESDIGFEGEAYTTDANGTVIVFPKAHQPFTVWFPFRYLGVEPSGDFMNRIDLDYPRNYSSLDIPFRSLNPLTLTSLSWHFPNGLPAGDHIFDAHLDVNFQIREADRVNNLSSIEVVVEP